MCPRRAVDRAVYTGAPCQRFTNIFRAGPAVWRHRSSVENCRYTPPSRLASRAPRAGKFVREFLTWDTITTLSDRQGRLRNHMFRHLCANASKSLKAARFARTG